MLMTLGVLNDDSQIVDLHLAWSDEIAEPVDIKIVWASPQSDTACPIRLVEPREHVYITFVGSHRDTFHREWIVAQCGCGARTAVLSQAKDRDNWDGIYPSEWIHDDLNK